MLTAARYFGKNDLNYTERGLSQNQQKILNAMIKYKVTIQSIDNIQSSKPYTNKS